MAFNLATFLVLTIMWWECGCTLMSGGSGSVFGPAPYFKPILPSFYGTISQTATLLNRSQVISQLKDKNKKTTEILRDVLLPVKEYVKFIKRNEILFGIKGNPATHERLSRYSEVKLRLLIASFHMLITECVDTRINDTNNNTVYFMGTGVAISKYEIITASHNIDCEFVNPHYKFRRIRTKRTGIAFDSLYDGIPHVDDIVILKARPSSAPIPMQYTPLKPDKKIKPLFYSKDYEANADIPILCIGFVGNTQSMYLKDGQTVNRTELDTIYGSSAELIASFGLIKSFDGLLNDTCGYMTRQISGLTHADCRKFYFDSNENVLKNVSIYDFVHNANVIEGMSGGICVNAYEPLSFIGINSHGTSNIIVETHPNATITTHHHTVGNCATLITQSNAYKKYSSWIYYFYRLANDFVRLANKTKSEL